MFFLWFFSLTEWKKTFGTVGRFLLKVMGTMLKNKTHCLIINFIHLLNFFGFILTPCLIYELWQCEAYYFSTGPRIFEAFHLNSKYCSVLDYFRLTLFIRNLR